MLFEKPRSLLSLCKRIFRASSFLGTGLFLTPIPVHKSHFLFSTEKANLAIGEKSFGALPTYKASQDRYFPPWRPRYCKTCFPNDGLCDWQVGAAKAGRTPNGERIGETLLLARIRPLL